MFILKQSIYYLTNSKIYKNSNAPTVPVYKTPSGKQANCSALELDQMREAVFQIDTSSLDRFPRLLLIARFQLHNEADSHFGSGYLSFVLVCSLKEFALSAIATYLVLACQSKLTGATVLCKTLSQNLPLSFIPPVFPGTR